MLLLKGGGGVAELLRLNNQFATGRLRAMVNNRSGHRVVERVIPSWRRLLRRHRHVRPQLRTPENNTIDSSHSPSIHFIEQSCDFCKGLSKNGWGL